MPERPDLEVYVEHLQARIGGQPLTGLRIASPFVLRSAVPPAEAFVGRTVAGVRRLAKRIVIDFGDDWCAVIHLMISGRLHWKSPGAVIPKRNGLLAFDFEGGTLTLTEAAKKKRASLHLVGDAPGLAALDPGGIEVQPEDFDGFRAALTSRNHTVKRALTDQRLLKGIGNAYSDEILWQAKLSPFRQTANLDDAELGALFFATLSVLDEWQQRLRAKAGDAFPEKVTAFHPEMAVHGRHGEPCPRCASPVQRIVFADNEANYCARCQTGGRLLADRALSRLLHDNWPKTLEELEGG